MKSPAVGWHLRFLAPIAFILGCGGSPEESVVGPYDSAGSLDPAVVTCPARLSGKLAWYQANFTAGTMIPFMNTDYVSQGLGYWASKDWLITSHSPVPNVIAIKNRSTGAFVKYLYVQRSGGSAILGHMGGLSVSSNNLWLSTDSGTRNLFRIPLSAISNAANGGTVRANGEWSVKASSYNTYYSTGTGAYIIVGAFKEALTGTATMYRYLLNSSEGFTTTSLASPAAISTPTRVQGIAVANGYYIFSTSYGRKCYSQLQFKSTSTGRIDRKIEIPPMSEGIVRVPRGATGWADDWLYVNFESGSALYTDAALRTFHFQHAVITKLTP